MNRYDRGNGHVFSHTVYGHLTLDSAFKGCWLLPIYSFNLRLKGCFRMQGGLHIVFVEVLLHQCPFKRERLHLELPNSLISLGIEYTHSII